MLILGIETSCDETAASVVKNGKEILSNIISSSLNFHRRFGGVIPEIAARHHVENIDRVISRSVYKAGIGVRDIDAIAVTQGPGLVGALLTGIACAKAMAYVLGITLIAVDHVKAHLYSALMHDRMPKFPFIGLVISGGHTRLCIVKDFDDIDILGDTLDDAIGEAYDKVAKIMGLGYPGGPIIDRLAKNGDANSIRFNCRGVAGGFDFSFSGIKTAVLYYVKSHGLRLANRPSTSSPSGEASLLGTGESQNISASFQEPALRLIVKNTIKALEMHNLKTLVIGGGVSANSRFREMIKKEALFRKIKLYFPAFSLCSDNAAMVAGLAYHLYKKGKASSLDMTVQL